MRKLIVQKNLKKQFEIALSELPEKFLVGSAHAHILIDDRKISLPHLEILAANGAYAVEDKNSAFGTRLNGREISGKTPFQEGDLIGLGEHALTILDVAEAKNGAGRKGKSKKERLLAPSAAHQFELHATKGPLANQSFKLQQKVTRLGRYAELNDIVINCTKSQQPDNSISRQHASISRQGSKYFVQDENSGNGTRLNGNRLNAGESRQLHDGDAVEIISSFENSVFIFRRVPEHESGLRNINTSSLSREETLRRRIKAAPPVASEPKFTIGPSALLFVAGVITLAISIWSHYGNLSLENIWPEFDARLLLWAASLLLGVIVLYWTGKYLRLQRTRSR